MAKAFVIDLARCAGCYNCQIACKDEHVGHNWDPYARSQPEIGQFWLKLNEETCGSTPKVKVNYTPKMCNHCAKAPCIDVCPTGAAYQREDGLVLFDPEKCSGCKKCMQACPYEGVIYFNEKANIAQKCTGCAHLLDNGVKEPRCVDACPTDALLFRDEEELRDDILGAAVLQPEDGTHPRVYYRNVPGKFIAGTVYDPESEEVVIGARIRAITGGKRYETFTDRFGDFWLNDLAVGKFDVFIEAEGYALRSFKALHTVKCINLGDIPMNKV